MIDEANRMLDDICNDMDTADEWTALGKMNFSATTKHAYMRAFDEVKHMFGSTSEAVRKISDVENDADYGKVLIEVAEMARFELGQQLHANCF